MPGCRPIGWQGTWGCSTVRYRTNLSALLSVHLSAEAGLAEVEAVPCEPAATFPERCCSAVAAAAAAGRPFDVVYVSQTTFLSQRTLVPDIPALVSGLRSAAGAGHPKQGASLGAARPTDALAGSGEARKADEQPLIIIDGGCAALPAT